MFKRVKEFFKRRKYELETGKKYVREDKQKNHAEQVMVDNN